MKKFLKQLLGYVIIVACGTAATLWTLYDVVLFIGAIIGKEDASNDIIFAAITTLPLLAYFWWAWCSKWSRDQIFNLIN